MIFDYKFVFHQSHMLPATAKLWLEDGDADRVSVSHGVRRAGSAQYVPAAFVPLPRWQALSELDSLLLCADPEDSDVQVMSVAIRDVARIAAKLTSGLIADRIEGATLLADIARRKILCEGPASFDGVQFDRPGLETVTVSFDNRRLLGLHVDSWDGLALKDRHRARRRLSINIGTQPRHFVYLPRNLFEMVQQLQASDEAVPSDADNVVDQFLTRIPQNTVLRITLAPGDFYVAPVEYLVHDASTVGATGAGMSAVLRGHFRVFSPIVDAYAAS